IAHYRSFAFRLYEIKGTEKRLRLLTYSAGIASIAILASGASMLLIQLLRPESSVQLVSFQLLAILGFLTQAYPWWVNFWVFHLFFPRKHKLRPLDRALVDLAVIAYYAEKWKYQWFDAKRCRALIAELEATARRIESIAWRSRRVSLLDRQGTAEYRHDLLTLAFEVRKHKRILARSNGARDFEAVNASISGGCLALTMGDWASIIASSDVGLTSRALALWRRTLPGIVMIGASFLIPTLPGVSDSPELALSARVTLLASAALYLALPLDSPVTSRVLDTLGKSFK
ncbi:hypothetical protein AB0885_19065, partial [Streptomyces sp. NPDC005534]